MVFNRFRRIVFFRIILLSATIFSAIYLYNQENFILISILLGALGIYQIISLIHFSEKINRDLVRFLKSIQFSDFSQTFSSANLGPTFHELKKSFDSVTQQFLKVRAEKEERYQYFQTVVEHVGTGLISFKPDGEIEFMNKAAGQLLNSGSVRNIKSLEKINKEFVDKLLKLKAGEHTVVKLKHDGRFVHLAIHAAQFKLKQQKYTLVTLQDIQSEIERERIARELEIGQEVQKKLLPKMDFNIPGIDLAGFCLPAKEVGGDYYDIIEFENNQLGLLIGDVSGKGLPAAIYMTLTKGILQASIDSELSPAQALIKANRLIYQTIERGFFVSLFLSILDTKKHELVFSRAGHNPIIHFQANSQTINYLKPDGIALGLEDGTIFEEKIQESKIKLNKDDLIVLYTDGFSEAMNEKEQEFSEESLAQIIKDNHKLTANGLLDIIFDELESFVGDSPRHDDMTIVILKIDH